MFRIVEQPAAGALGAAVGGLFGGRPRTHTLKASSVEEAMDWAIAIRDAIAEWSAR